ncbi:MAG TPA: hypothetical protein VLA83_01685, partial [Candidatus Binatia bacterium]|nr:hypothetical protein [Candidatus Binatia bacterium]
IALASITPAITTAITGLSCTVRLAAYVGLEAAAVGSIIVTALTFGGEQLLAEIVEALCKAMGACSAKTIQAGC